MFIGLFCGRMGDPSADCDYSSRLGRSPEATAPLSRFGLKEAPLRCDVELPTVVRIWYGQLVRSVTGGAREHGPEDPAQLLLADR
jgi:hypothetical protein